MNHGGEWVGRYDIGSLYLPVIGQPAHSDPRPKALRTSRNGEVSCMRQTPGTFRDL